MHDPQLPLSEFVGEPRLEPCFRADWRKAHLPEWRKRHFRRGLLDRIESLCERCACAANKEPCPYCGGGPCGKAQRASFARWGHSVPGCEWAEWRECAASELWEAYRETLAPDYDWRGRHPELFE